jgi:hypothetical protein
MTCATCRYFSGLHNVCQRYPPTVVVINTKNGQDIGSMYPVQKPTNTCGEHKEVANA